MPFPWPPPSVDETLSVVPLRARVSLQEEELLKEIAQALDALRELTAGGQPVSADAGRRRELCGTVRNKCKVLKISLEQHVKGEEGQLWPMFVAHFSLAEQEELVGRIIGQTGAEVLKVRYGLGKLRESAKPEGAEG